MKTTFSLRGLFALGFLLLLVTNVVVLAGAWSNRSGSPEAQVMLTERELQLPYWVNKENSGFSLQLVWRTLGKKKGQVDYSGWRSPAWLDRGKLAELGFHVDDPAVPVDSARKRRDPVPKEVFIVLENDGAPYAKVLKGAAEALGEQKRLFESNNEDKKLRENFKRAQEGLTRERVSASRLFAIDAGLDAEELREKYNERTRFIITRGVVKLRYQYNKKKRTPSGYISRISVNKIHVPLKLRRIFDKIPMNKGKRDRQLSPPRYRVELAYGGRLEPWIRTVEPIAYPLDGKIND